MYILGLQRKHHSFIVEHKIESVLHNNLHIINKEAKSKSIRQHCVTDRYRFYLKEIKTM